MLGWWGWRNVSLLGSKQDGEELRKTMGGERPTMGKAKGQLSPSVTLCFTVPMVVSKAERDGQPWGQRGVRGPCLHNSPPRPNSLVLSRSLAKFAHQGRWPPSSSLQFCAHPAGRCIPSLTAGGVHPCRLGALE